MHCVTHEVWNRQVLRVVNRTETIASLLNFRESVGMKYIQRHRDNLLNSEICSRIAKEYSNIRISLTCNTRQIGHGSVSPIHLSTLYI